MRQVVVDYPDDLAEAAGLAPELMGGHLRLMAALKMSELGEVTSGKAAELAGMTRVEFLDTCARYRIPVFNYHDDEVAGELEGDVTPARPAISR